MKDLRIAVERIVRPLRSSERRKDRIREELLGHVMAAYEEERAVDENGAAERAARRLGDPAIVTRRLQDTIPVSERIMFYKIPLVKEWRESWRQRTAPGAEESPIKWSVRLTIYFLSLPMGFFFFVLLPGLKGLMRGWESLAGYYPFAFAVWLGMSVTMLLYFILIGAAAREAERGLRVRSGLLMASAVIMGPVVMLSGLLAFFWSRGLLEFTKTHLYILFAGSVVTAVVAPMISALHNAERRRWLEWESLDLDE